jgi:integrase/recombinase XerD
VVESVETSKFERVPSAHTAKGVSGMVEARRYRVETQPGETPVVVLWAPDGTVVDAVDAYLRDLTAADYSSATILAYAYALLDWFRYLDGTGLAWDTAERAHVRDYVLALRAAVAAPATINHRLSIVKSFYAFHRAWGRGPARNPVPDGPAGARANAHRAPDDPWLPRRRAPYRQQAPEHLPRAIPEAVWERWFAALTHDRDRAIFCLLLSAGCRAGELLGMRVADVDWGRGCVRLITKGTRAAQWVAASPAFFQWLARYLAGRGPVAAEAPLWCTLRQPARPLTYQALRKVVERLNATLGTDLVVHDFRHTCALRLASDPAVPLIDVQAHLRHQHLSTTERYLRVHPEEVIARVQAHQATGTASPRTTETPASSDAWRYDPADLRVLLGQEAAE